MNKKVMYPIFNCLLWAAGFPVLFIIALVKSIEFNEPGLYGASAFAPMIAVIVLAVLVLGIQAAVYFVSKKKGKTGTKMLIKLMLIPVIIIIGIMGILDIALPPLLDTMTFSTMLYEDVVEDYEGMHNRLVGIFEELKERNNIDPKAKYTDAEVQFIFDKIFPSMDDAYNAFDSVAIGYALDQEDLLAGILNGNFPIEIAAGLLLITEFEVKDGKYVYKHLDDNGVPKDLDTILKDNYDNIDDSIKDIIIDVVMGQIDINDLMPLLNTVLDKLLVSFEFDGMSWNIFDILGQNIIDPNAYTGEQVIDGKTYYALGYQDMAWLNSVQLMFFIPLMSIRNLLYLFAALLAIFTAAQYYAASIYSEKYGKPFSLAMFK